IVHASESGIIDEQQMGNISPYITLCKRDGGATRPHRSSAGIVRVRVEELLAADLVRGNRTLSCRGNEPVDEFLTELLFHVRMLFGIHQHHTVLVEQAFVALDQDRKIAAILKSKPGPAVRENIGAQAGCGIECRSHALSRIAIPRASGPLNIDTRLLPQLELGDVRAAAVTA